MAQQPQGCLRRFVVTVFSVAIVVSALSFLVYQRIGGSEGIKRRLANMALSATEKRMLFYRPDGVSEQQIRETIAAVREANRRPEAVDLIELYRVLREYDSRFHKSKPSTDEMLEFLARLRATIRQPPPE